MHLFGRFFLHGGRTKIYQCNFVTYVNDVRCNFAERDAIFQFLKLFSKPCQPTEFRYFRAKKFKSCFQDQTVGYIGFWDLKNIASPHGI